MRGRATSCYCAVLGHMAPCSWCTEYSRPCEGCGEIFDREDVNEFGYCGECEKDNMIEHALQSSVVAEKAREIDMALFGLDEDETALFGPSPVRRPHQPLRPARPALFKTPERRKGQPNVPR
jgi:hypothetical protein